MAPKKTSSVPEPTQGGSYVRNDDGSLMRVEEPTRPSTVAERNLARERARRQAAERSQATDTAKVREAAWRAVAVAIESGAKQKPVQQLLECGDWSALEFSLFLADTVAQLSTRPNPAMAILKHVAQQAMRFGKMSHRRHASVVLVELAWRDHKSECKRKGVRLMKAAFSRRMEKTLKEKGMFVLSADNIEKQVLRGL